MKSMVGMPGLVSSATRANHAMYILIQSASSPGIPCDPTLQSNLPCGTLSNDLLKSYIQHPQLCLKRPKEKQASAFKINWLIKENN